ncbi:MAG: hypothetical protein F6K37_26665 [Moorea sp. SIO4E2]|uniref:hypothetical protein n=1 Tax=Moorena sp. SIO4E2 TaxID=2607826 RepID=UPI0013B68D88|nr:hypothetical protein [Moorena sp. SIO4E2]NEQ09400.1 hypothetical protein [Moorena sp. SIO4E2]
MTSAISYQLSAISYQLSANALQMVLLEVRSAVSGQRSAYFIQKHRLRYAHTARTVAWNRLRRYDLRHKLNAEC